MVKAGTSNGPAERPARLQRQLDNVQGEPGLHGRAPMLVVSILATGGPSTRKKHLVSKSYVDFCRSLALFQGTSIAIDPLGIHLQEIDDSWLH